MAKRENVPKEATGVRHTIMASNAPTAPKMNFNVMAGIASYLVPGLGQILSGRVAKGLLFLVCIYALFFYGTYLGAQEITIDKKTYSNVSVVYLPSTADNTTGQRNALGSLASDLYARPQFAGQFWAGVVSWPAIMQYRKDPQLRDEKLPYIGHYQSEPSQAALNAVHNAGDKRLELAWVFTVIAGVLNILVIYDAIAGPAFATATPSEKKTN